MKVPLCLYYILRAMSGEVNGPPLGVVRLCCIYLAIAICLDTIKTLYNRCRWNDLLGHIKVVERK